MATHKSGISFQLNLRAGELVEVRSREEIFSTLDKEGKLDALPFMPEMLKYCGKQMRVYKRAHKTCDTIDKTGGRGMANAVHLEGARCDGEAHGGCQAECLIFWKEAWLKRVQSDSVGKTAADDRPSITEETLLKATRIDTADGSGEETYSCQATELLKATSPLPWWDLRQYVTDITSGNVGVGEVARVFSFWLFTKSLKLGGWSFQIRLFNRIQRFLGGKQFPYTSGNLKKTPSETLNLQPGELIQIKPLDEIRATIDVGGKNRGLSFDPEMSIYCGEEHRVLRRVDKIIHEKTGKMMQMKNDCIILEGVVCTAQYSHFRKFCPRAIYPYWREIWLKRPE